MMNLLDKAASINRSDAKEILSHRLRVDTKSLAVLRIVLGLLIVADLVLRSSNLTFFYSDAGAMPRTLAAEIQSPARAGISVYNLVGSPEGTLFLFLVQALVAVFLILGYRTTVMTTVSFFFVLSLDIRNPLVLSYGDSLLRALLFWSVFLPLGERWSIDAHQRTRKTRPYVSGVATFLILGQVVYMYLTNGLLKIDSELWRTGEAAVVVMGQDEVTYLIGDLLRDFPILLQIGGLLWFSLLLTSPMLLVLSGRRRALLAMAFIAGHLSFALTVRIGTFPLIAIAGLTLFIQPNVWELGSDMIRKTGLESRRSYVVTRLSESGGSLAEYLPAPNKRDWMSTLHRFVLGIVVFGVAVSLLFAVVPMDSDDRVPVRDEVRGVADTVGMSQGFWSVFAGPETADRYYVFPAETTSGATVDAFNSRELTLQRPYDELQRQYGTYRERFYMDNLRLAAEHGNPVPAGYLAEYLCETWRGEDGESLSHINMVMLSEDVTVDTVNTPEDRHRSASRFYVHGCGDNEPKEVLGL